MLETMNMTRTSTDSGLGRPTCPERAFVLAGLALAPLATGVALASGAGLAAAGPAWLAALAWTVLASLACALRRGFRHRDWSAFHSRGCAGDGGELDEWASRTGRYAWLGNHEDRLREDDGLR